MVEHTHTSVLALHAFYRFLHSLLEHLLAVHVLARRNFLQLSHLAQQVQALPALGSQGYTRAICANRYALLESHSQRTNDDQLDWKFQQICCK